MRVKQGAKTLDAVIVGSPSEPDTSWSTT